MEPLGDIHVHSSFMGEKTKIRKKNKKARKRQNSKSVAWIQRDSTCIYGSNFSYCESHTVQLASLPTRGMLLTLVYLSTLKLAPHTAPSLSTLGIAFILYIGCSKLINPPSLWNIHPATPTNKLCYLIPFFFSFFYSSYELNRKEWFRSGIIG